MPQELLLHTYQEAETKIKAIKSLAMSNVGETAEQLEGTHTLPAGIIQPLRKIVGPSHMIH